MSQLVSDITESNAPEQSAIDPSEVLRQAASDLQADVAATLMAPGNTPRVSVVGGFDPSAVSVLRSAGHDVSRMVAAAMAPYDIRRFLFLCESATNKTKIRGRQT